MTIKMPTNFEGLKFLTKFGLGEDDFWAIKGELHCPSLPTLTENDIADCVVTPPEPVTEMVYDYAIVATDFRVQSPKIPADRKKALQDAVKESKKVSKSVPFIAMANTHVLEGLLARVEDLEKQLKKMSI